jgi:hypothetical protein
VVQRLTDHVIGYGLPKKVIASRQADQGYRVIEVIAPDTPYTAMADDTDREVGAETIPIVLSL